MVRDDKPSEQEEKQAKSESRTDVVDCCPNCGSEQVSGSWGHGECDNCGRDFSY